MKIRNYGALLMCVLLLAGGCSSAPSSSASSPASASSAASSSSAPSAPSTPAPTPSPSLEAPDQITSMSQLMDFVNAKHRAIERPSVDFTEYMLSPIEMDFNIFDYQEGKEFAPDATLSADQVKEDVDIFFNTLKTTYGPYRYFGDDTVFLAAKEAVLKACATPEGCAAQALQESLVKELAFINDGHFAINGDNVRASLIPYFYKETAFAKAGDGFTTLDGTKKVASVDGTDADLKDLFKMSISDEGKIIYYPVVFGAFSRENMAAPDDLTVHYEDGSTQTLSPSPYESNYDHTDKMVDLHYNEDVPVLFVRNMGFDEAIDDVMGRQFLDYADQLKDEPVLIIDLRSNGGGNSILPLKWLKKYTGQLISSNFASLQYWSEESMQSFFQEKENTYYISDESMKEYNQYERLNENYLELNKLPDTFVQNDRLLILLTGKNTASAAETFTDAVHNVENTLVIGQNTFGCLVSNAYNVIYLPNSGISLQLGCNLNIFPEGDFEEFMGYQPDLWVDSDAESLAVKLVKNLK